MRALHAPAEGIVTSSDSDAMLVSGRRFTPLSYFCVKKSLRTDAFVMKQKVVKTILSRISPRNFLARG